MHLPSLGHLIAPVAYPERHDRVLGLEISGWNGTAVWILVLMASGIYLWWPRVDRGHEAAAERFGGERGGRIRWRDLHALTGVVIAVVLICYVLSGIDVVAVLG